MEAEKRHRTPSRERHRSVRSRVNAQVSVKIGNKTVKVCIPYQGSTAGSVLGAMGKTGKLLLNGSLLTHDAGVFADEELVFEEFEAAEDFPTVPFASPVFDSVLPFKGRQTVMKEVAEQVRMFSNRFTSTDPLHPGEMLFITFEGLSGVGKTRCLMETPKQVGDHVGEGALKKLYASGCVHAVYMSFNAANYAGREAHQVGSFFREMIRTHGVARAGVEFMRCSLVSEVLYSRSFDELPLKTAEVVILEDTESSMRRVAAHIRSGLQSSDEEKFIVLYVLLDEVQLLAKKTEMTFLGGVFSMMGNYMLGGLPSELKLALIPVLAGTFLPVGETSGLTSWLNKRYALEPLDEQTGCRVLSDALGAGSINTEEPQLRWLVKDCMALPMLLRHLYGAWHDARSRSRMTNDIFLYLRTYITLQLDKWVENIMRADGEDVMTMMRLCLSGEVVPRVSASATEQCTLGYVFPRRVQGGYVYKAPLLLLNALSRATFGMHMPLVELRPDVAKAEVLELAFMEMLYVRMLLKRNSICRLSDIIPGIRGSFQMLLRIGAEIRREGEKHQFIYPKEKRFHSERDASVQTESGEVLLLPAFDVLLKTTGGCAHVDGRLFLRGKDEDQANAHEWETIELWVQIKGQQSPWSLGDIQKLVENLRKYPVQGRRRVLLVVARHGISGSPHQQVWDSQTHDFSVHFLDATGLERFMPGYLGRSAALA